MEVFVNTNRSTLMVSDKAFDGKPVEQRQAINDTRGRIAELLAKAVNQGALPRLFAGASSPGCQVVERSE
jgi:monoamine oxidase